MTNPFNQFNPVLMAHEAGNNVNPDVPKPVEPVPVVAPTVETPAPVTAPAETPVVTEEVTTTPTTDSTVADTAPEPDTESGTTAQVEELDELDKAMAEVAEEEEAAAKAAEEEEASPFYDPDVLEEMTLEQREQFFPHVDYLAVRISSKKLEAENHLGKKVVARDAYPSTMLYIPKLDLCNNPKHAEIAQELYARWVKVQCQQEETEAWKAWARSQPMADGSKELPPFVNNHKEPEKNEKSAFAFFNGMMLPIVTDMDSIEDVLYPTTHDDWVEWCLKGGFWDVMVAFYKTMKSGMADKDPKEVLQARTLASRIHANGMNPNYFNALCARLDALNDCTIPAVVEVKERHQFSRFYAYHKKRIAAVNDTPADIF